MPAPPKKIGGEYGEVRAGIDADNLNAYLQKAAPSIASPVAIKQFKVRRYSVHTIIRPLLTLERSLDR